MDTERASALVIHGRFLSPLSSLRSGCDSPATPDCSVPALSLLCSLLAPSRLLVPGSSERHQLLSGHWGSEKKIRMKKVLKKDSIPAFSTFHGLPASVQGCFSFSVGLGISRGGSFLKSCPAETMTGRTATVTPLSSIPNLYKSSFEFATPSIHN